MKAAEEVGKIASELKTVTEEKKPENIELQAQIKEAKEADDATLQESCLQLEAAKEIKFNTQYYAFFKSQIKTMKTGEEIGILIYALAKNCWRRRSIIWLTQNSSRRCRTIT